MALAKLVINFNTVELGKVTINWVTCILEKFKLHMHCLDAWVSYAIHQELIEAAS